MKDSYLNVAISLSNYPCKLLCLSVMGQNQQRFKGDNTLVGKFGEPLVVDIKFEYGYCSEEISLLWLSLLEKKCYECSISIESIKNNNELFTRNIILGLLPFGRICLWHKDVRKSYFIDTFEGKEKNIKLSDYINGNFSQSVDACCDYYMAIIAFPQGIDITHKLNRQVVDKYMQQFTYRYIYLDESWDEDNFKWNKIEQDVTVSCFDFIEESLYDGTHDKLHDGGLMKYHQAGKPKKLRVEWHIGKSEYSAYFWFEDERIREVFDRFYGAHPDTKTDFIIRIDAEKRKYELALYRYGLKEPQVIPEDVYQLLVFKNKFEDYRSDNYNQERGAWIW